MTKCAVRMCKNHTSKNQTDVTFFRFPQNLILREKWKKNIGRVRGIESSVICSTHFLESDMYLTKGFRCLKNNAVPQLKCNLDVEAAHVEVCQVCLATDVKFYNLQHSKWKNLMYLVTRFHDDKIDGLPRYMCYECGAHILKYHRLIEKSKIAQTTLLDIYNEDGQITKDLVKRRDRVLLNLQSSFGFNNISLLNILRKEDNSLCNKSSSPVQIEISDIVSRMYVQNDKRISSHENHNVAIKDEQTVVGLLKGDDEDKTVVGLLSDELINTEDNLISNCEDETGNSNDNRIINIFKSESESYETDIENELLINSEKYIVLITNNISVNNEMVESKLLNNKDVLTEIHDETEYSKNDSNEDNSEDRVVMKAAGNSEIPLPNGNNDKKNVKKRCKKTAPSISKNLKETKRRRKTIPSKHTPNDSFITEKLKYYNIMDLSLQEQIDAWKTEVEKIWWVTEDVYKCDICLKKFPKKKACEKHIAHHNPRRGKFECAVCKERYANQIRLDTHTVRTHSKKYLCIKCPKILYNYKAAHRHENKHSGKVYQCEHCAYSTQNRSTFWEHVRRAHNQHVHCARCGRACTNRHGLATHLAIAHPGEIDVPEKFFRCEPCDFDFYSEGALHVHILTAQQHRDEDKSTRDPSIKTTCKRCAVRFETRSEMLNHVRATHIRHTHRPQVGKPDPNYPKSCEHCGLAIASRREHWRHMREAHRELRHTYKPAVNFICEKCGKGYQSKVQLRMHSLRHEPRRVACACGARFHDDAALALHSATHSADRPFACAHCPLRFKSASNMSRHLRKHSGVMPYHCNLCGKKFKYWDSLHQHVKHTHQKMPWPARKRRTARPKKTVDTDESDVDTDK